MFAVYGLVFLLMLFGFGWKQFGWLCCGAICVCDFVFSGRINFVDWIRVTWVACVWWGLFTCLVLNSGRVDIKYWLLLYCDCGFLCMGCLQIVLICVWLNFVVFMLCMCALLFFCWIVRLFVSCFVLIVLGIMYKGLLYLPYIWMFNSRVRFHTSFLVYYYLTWLTVMIISRRCCWLVGNCFGFRLVVKLFVLVCRLDWFGALLVVWVGCIWLTALLIRDLFCGIESVGLCWLILGCSYWLSSCVWFSRILFVLLSLSWLWLQWRQWLPLVGWCFWYDFVTMTFQFVFSFCFDYLVDFRLFSAFMATFVLLALVDMFLIWVVDVFGVCVC